MKDKIKENILKEIEETGLGFIYYKDEPVKAREFQEAIIELAIQEINKQWIEKIEEFQEKTKDIDAEYFPDSLSEEDKINCVVFIFIEGLEKLKQEMSK